MLRDDHWVSLLPSVNCMCVELLPLDVSSTDGVFHRRKVECSLLMLHET